MPLNCWKKAHAARAVGDVGQSVEVEGVAMAGGRQGGGGGWWCF